MFRPSRTRRGPDPYLDWKVALFVAGAAAGSVGMATGSRWLVGTAIVLLGAGVALRAARRPGAGEEPAPGDDAE